MDRLVAVDGKVVDDCTHEQVVDMIMLSGNDCCLLVVDKHADQIYKLVSEGASLKLFHRLQTVYIMCNHCVSHRAKCLLCFSGRR